jgi:hypothetical protein
LMAEMFKTRQSAAGFNSGVSHRSSVQMQGAE